MDALDRQIVDVLREEARISVSDLAQRVGISRAAAYARFNRLQESGTIRGFRADVEPSALGLDLAAYVHVRIKQNSWKSFRRKAWALHEAEHVALVAGDFDCVLLVRARNADHLRELVLEQVQALPEVVATQTVLIFEEHHDGTP